MGGENGNSKDDEVARILIILIMLNIGRLATGIDFARIDFL